MVSKDNWKWEGCETRECTVSLFNRNMCIVWLASVNLFKLNVYLVSKTRNFGVNKEYVGALKLTLLRLLV